MQDLDEEKLKTYLMYDFFAVAQEQISEHVKEGNGSKLKSNETFEKLTVYYPEGAYGYVEPPNEYEYIFIDNATVWTCTKKGVIEETDIIVKNGTSINKIYVLQCNSEYPTPYSDVNLNAMLKIKEKFKQNSL